MSPKLYDAISEKFQNVWGNYAGWAHSVRLLYYKGGYTLIASSGIVHRRLESLFGLRAAHTDPFAEQSCDIFARKGGLFLSSNSFAAQETGETSKDSRRIGRRKCFVHRRKYRRANQFSRAREETTKIEGIWMIQVITDTGCTTIVRPSLDHILQIRTTENSANK